MTTLRFLARIIVLFVHERAFLVFVNRGWLRPWIGSSRVEGSTIFLLEFTVRVTLTVVVYHETNSILADVRLIRVKSGAFRVTLILHS